MVSIKRLHCAKMAEWIAVMLRETLEVCDLSLKNCV